MVGLVNCGNSCYMNALLQSLLHSDLGRYTQVPFNQIAFAQGINKDASLFRRFYDLATDYKKTNQPSISTKEIAAARTMFMPALVPGEQADAEEYLKAFFNRLDEELNFINHKPAYYTPTDQERANFLFEYYRVKSGAYSGEYSIIQDLFGGFVKNVITKTDGKISINYEPVTTLPIQFPKNIQDGDTVDLNKMLSDYSKTEPMINSKGNKSKQISIFKAPKTLIIHLVRFLQNGTHIKKIEASVNFLTQFNLTTEMDGAIDFDLFAVVIHSGSLIGGHYTAYVKTPDQKWFYADDSAITPVTEAELLQQKSGAYVLFYKKK